MTMLFAPFGAVNARFETGQPATLGMRIMEILSKVLLYPIFSPGAELLGNTSGHALMLGNSIVSGAPIVGLISVARSRLGSSAPRPVRTGA